MIDKVASMFDSLNVTKIFVLDQDEALDFYVGKLGLEVTADYPGGGGIRWLTVAVPGDKDHAILLEKPAPPSIDEASAAQIRDLLTKGALGFGLAFTTPDCRKTYETLVARGVEITQELAERPYGIDCGVRDPFGNQIRILQPAQRLREAKA
jgi:catechol 2,3-dioxygenase-like lactoylglutathione lyase family enzyme